MQLLHGNESNITWFTELETWVSHW